MILVDANLLIYSSNSAAPQHQQALQWLEQQLSDAPRIGIPWASLLAFVRIITNPRIIRQPLSIELAWKQVEGWLGVESVWIPLPTDRHQAVLGRLLLASGASGNLVSDAHIAALAIEHGLTLYSFDGDFAAFPGLRWVNPLAPRPTR